MNFANKTKLNIILALENRPLSVKEITEKIKAEQSRISHNLSKLLQCHMTVVPILKIVKKHVKKNCLKGCNKKIS